ncbi:hypothetical protein [Microvirga massiliensis]|uniref:hypothetical protein n=1 Tax=Microvirga massiliensis TaxID=1033741 RepID=UPI000AFCE8F6|nr:hypothetical protein [Microvirga massiliensis]
MREDSDLENGIAVGENDPGNTMQLDRLVTKGDRDPIRRGVHRDSGALLRRPVYKMYDVVSAAADHGIVSIGLPDQDKGTANGAL